MHRPVIALDADGVLLDYSTAYAQAWELAFGVRPAERDPKAYWPMDRWVVERLSGDRLERFRSCFDTAFWSTIPAINGAVEACNAMHDAGHTLVCVSALDSRFEAARLKNLRDEGFPIERVIATNATAEVESPKAQALRMLMPVAFVDDYLPYFRGVPAAIHCALIHRETAGSPNVGPDLSAVASQHHDLADFARWWLDRA